MGVLERVRRVRPEGEGARTERLAEQALAVKHAMLERVGFEEVARIAAEPDPVRARDELGPPSRRC